MMTSCEEERVDPVAIQHHDDLDEIIKKGKLTALVQYSSHGYFLYKGTPLGFEYELLKSYAEEIGVDLEIKEVSVWDTLVQKLNRGEGDLIAANLQVSLDLKKEVLFTENHNVSRLVLVQRKPTMWRKMKLHQIRAEIVKDPLELSGEVVSVRTGTHYMKRLAKLSEELGEEIKVDSITELVSLEKIAEWVNDGRIDYTIMEEHQAKMFAKVYPILDVSVPVSFRHKVAWAVPSTSGQLKSSIDRWMRGMKRLENPKYFILYNKYFKNARGHSKRKRSEWYGLRNGKISPYDKTFKSHETKKYPWTLLAAMAYQESRFVASKTSWVGAMGLMQIMPETAEQFKVKKPYKAYENVAGAVRYLRFLEKEYWSELPENEKWSFILASYNSGPGHVLDARRLAEKYGKNPNVWSDVESFLMKLSHAEFYYDPVVKYGYCRGSEPVHYVREILNRHKVYQNFLEKQNNVTKVEIEIDSFTQEVDSSSLKVK